MTTTAYDQPRRPHRASWAPFVRHYIEMVLAMVIGMVALMPLESCARERSLTSVLTAALR